MNTTSLQRNSDAFGCATKLLKISDAKPIKHISDKGNIKSRLILSQNHTGLNVYAVATKDLLDYPILRNFTSYYYTALKNTDISININSVAKRLGLSKSKVVEIAQMEGCLEEFTKIAEARALALPLYKKIAQYYVIESGRLQTMVKKHVIKSGKLVFLGDAVKTEFTPDSGD